MRVRYCTDWCLYLRSNLNRNELQYTIKHSAMFMENRLRPHCFIWVHPIEDFNNARTLLIHRPTLIFNGHWNVRKITSIRSGEYFTICGFCAKWAYILVENLKKKHLCIWGMSWKKNLGLHYHNFNLDDGHRWSLANAMGGKRNIHIART